MRVNIYVEVKKHEVEFAMYPLYIDTTNKNVGKIQIFYVLTGVIAWICYSYTLFLIFEFVY